MNMKNASGRSSACIAPAMEKTWRGLRASSVRQSPFLLISTDPRCSCLSHRPFMEKKLDKQLDVAKKACGRRTSLCLPARGDLALVYRSKVSRHGPQTPAPPSFTAVWYGTVQTAGTVPKEQGLGVPHARRTAHGAYHAAGLAVAAQPNTWSVLLCPISDGSMAHSCILSAYNHLHILYADIQTRQHLSIEHALCFD
eukprot:354888-Chlamydomonas_euryale.AAC.1